MSLSDSIYQNPLSIDDWDRLFSSAASKRQGIVISKMPPPAGVPCDHKESVWDFHQDVLKRMMDKYGYRVGWESRTQIGLYAVFSPC